MFRSSSQIWAELHEKAFRRLGGVTRVVVLDNLREGVLTPDIYDPTLNPLYRDVLPHYGVVALPCRVRDPDRKGKVESGVGHAKKTPLKGQRFESLEEAQAYLDHWEERWADTRIHGTTKRQVAAMFAEEQPALAAAAGRTFPLLPIRRAHGPSGWLRGSRSGLLQRAAGLDRPARPGAMGSPARPPAAPADRPIVARTLAPGARQPSDQRRGPPQTNAARARNNCWPAPTRPARRSERCAAGCTRQSGEIAVRRIQGVLSLAKKHGARHRGGCLRRGPGSRRLPITVLCAAIWSGARNCR